jgi:hypothetical protein
MGARAFIPAALAATILLSLAPSTPAAAATPRTTEAQQIIKIAEAHLGAHWVHGAIGPRVFDCSGLVIYAYRTAGDGKTIRSGALRSASALYRWFKARGLASRSNPKPGDLVIWGGGSHVGIYIGNGKAISTLTNGVRIHGVHAVRAAFTAYLHTGMSLKLVKASPVKTTVKPTVSVAKASARPAKVAAKSSAVVRHVRGAVNLRSGPGLAYARVRTLVNGARVIVIGRRADHRGHIWFHVRTAGRTGWVAGWLTR